MTVAVANTELTNSLNYLRVRVNELADAMSTQVVTLNTGPETGAIQTSGNVEANAVFVRSLLRGGNTGTANVLYIGSNVVVNSTLLTVNTVLVGNSSSNSYANSTLYRIGANVVFTTGDITVGNSSVNTYVNSTSFVLGNSSANAVVNSTGFFLNGDLFSSQSPIDTLTSGTSAQVIDTFNAAIYRTAEYLVSIKDNDANRFQSAKLLVVHDGSVAQITEFGVISTDNPLGTFSADINAGNCRLLLTPLVSNTQVKGVRTSVDV